MIVVLSLNTAIDRILEVPGFAAGQVFRADQHAAHAGGKGFNVARVVRALGAPVRLVGFLGGSPAAVIRTACHDLGIDGRWVATAGESRTCVIVTDPAGGRETVINEAGPSVSAIEVAALRAAIESAVRPGDLLLISGSAPPGVPEDFYAELVTGLHTRDVRVLADVSGTVLEYTAAAGPWALTPNLEEFAGAFGAVPPAQAARQLAGRTVHALLTLGSAGAIYVGPGGAVRLSPPPVQAVNAVGSGDALVAGFAVAIERGLPPAEAARWGVACGADNARRRSPGIGSVGEVERLVAGVHLQPLGEQ